MRIKGRFVPFTKMGAPGPRSLSTSQSEDGRRPPTSVNIVPIVQDTAGIGRMADDWVVVSYSAPMVRT